MQFGMGPTAALVTALYNSYRRFSTGATITFDGNSDDAGPAIRKSEPEAAQNTSIAEKPPGPGAPPVSESQKVAPDPPPLPGPLASAQSAILPIAPVEKPGTLPPDQPVAAPVQGSVV